MFYLTFNKVLSWTTLPHNKAYYRLTAMHPLLDLYHTIYHDDSPAWFLLQHYHYDCLLCLYQVLSLCVPLLDLHHSPITIILVLNLFHSLITMISVLVLYHRHITMILVLDLYHSFITMILVLDLYHSFITMILVLDLYLSSITMIPVCTWSLP